MAKGRKTGGRQAGTPNRVTADAREACASLVDDPQYRQNLAERLRAGRLAPGVEVMLWHYAKGKPTEPIEANQHITVSWQNEIVSRLTGATGRALTRPKTADEDATE